jgi:hypothetical protein
LLVFSNEIDVVVIEDAYQEQQFLDYLPGSRPA